MFFNGKDTRFSITLQETLDWIWDESKSKCFSVWRRKDVRRGVAATLFIRGYSYDGKTCPFLMKAQSICRGYIRHATSNVCMDCWPRSEYMTWLRKVDFFCGVRTTAHAHPSKNQACIWYSDGQDLEFIGGCEDFRFWVKKRKERGLRL